LHVRTPYGPRPGFPPASPCPGVDRPVSSRTAVTSGPYQTPPLGGYTPCGLVGFPPPSGLGEPLGSPRPRTPRPVFQDGAGDPGIPPRPHGEGSSGGLPLRAAHVCYRPVSGAFHPPPGVLFTFRSRYWCAIGLGTYLALEADGPRLPAPNPRCGTREPGHHPSRLPLRGSTSARGDL